MHLFAFLQTGVECDKIAKIVEKSLASESPPIVQVKCTSMSILYYV